MMYENIRLVALGNTTQASSASVQLKDFNFQGAGNAYVGANGGTVLVSVPINYLNAFEPNPLVTGSAVSSHGVASKNMVPFLLQEPLAVSRLNILKSWNIATTSSSNSSYSGSFVFSQSAELWVRSDTGANSSVLMNYFSSTVGFSLTSSGTSNQWSMGYTYMTNLNSTSFGTSSFSTASTGMNFSSYLTGLKNMFVPFITSLTVGEYWLALQHSSTATTAGINQFLSMSNLYVSHQITSLRDLANRTVMPFSQGLGVFSNTTATTLLLSNISMNLPHRLYFNMVNFPNY